MAAIDRMNTQTPDPTTTNKDGAHEAPGKQAHRRSGKRLARQGLQRAEEELHPLRGRTLSRAGRRLEFCRDMPHFLETCLTPALVELA